MKGSSNKLVAQFFSFYKRSWKKYEQFGRKIILHDAVYEIKDIFYWRDKLFVRTILYSFPVSILILIPSGILAFVNQGFLIPTTSFLTLLANFCVHFNRKVPLQIKKAFAVVSLTLLSIFFIATFGSFGMGSIYLLSLAVFISLIFSYKIAYGSVVFNFIIYTAFAIIIDQKLFNLPIIAHYPLKTWVGYSLNFMFLNLLVVFETRHILYGLEKTILEEERLLEQLKVEVTENNSRTALLKESDEHYQSLFFLNPSSMWIFDGQTLEFLQVNSAAIKEYGYSEAEFLNMTIRDIRVDPLDDILLLIENIFLTNVVASIITQHKRKDGQVFYADVKCSTIPFKGNKAMLVIATNINGQIQHTRAIEEQNEKLRKIAFMQSHVIRAPLARIKGLCNLLMLESDEKAHQQILDYLDDSVNELDDVIRSIVQHSQSTSLNKHEN